MNWRLFVIVLVVSFRLPLPCFAQQANQGYFYDEKILSDEQRNRYLAVRESLNDSVGGERKLALVKTQIEQFISGNPKFLPIYIEQARYTIMLGYTGIKEVEQYDREALAIVESIQRKDGQYAMSYVLAGHIYTNLGEYENAALALKKAGNLGSTDPWLFLNWATLRSQQRDIESALSFSRQGLEHSRSNTKALAYAIFLVSDLSSRLNKKAEIDLDKMIFKTFDDPVVRLDLARRLVSQYRGRPEILSYAYQIAMRQKKETPDLPECDFTIAAIVLAAGFTFVKDDIARYSSQSVATAKELLEPHINDEKIKEGVVYKLFGIAMSSNDFKRAQELISHAEKNGYKPATIKQMQATFAYSQGRYMEAIERMNELVAIDAGWEGMDLLARAYDRLGDAKILEDYHKMSISRNPTDAWSLGNYATYLLHKKGDYLGAIEYGERAMEIMNYPSVIGNTAMAYHVAAADYLKKGDRNKAATYYATGKKLGVGQSYMNKYCGKFCDDLKKLSELK